MGLVQKTPAQIQQRFATVYAANAKRIANLGKGSALGAIQNALVALALDLQQQIGYAANLSRLVTSASNISGINSPDVDSFTETFRVFRDPAVAATLPVQFGCNSPASQQLLISAYNPTTNTGGTYVQTATGIQFLVIADTSQSGYNATLNAYVIPIGQTTVVATVQAVIPGSGGNAQAGTITQILSLPGAPAPVGVSTVTNPSGTSTGVDAETDSELIARFQTIMSGKWATPLGVEASVEGAQNGLTFQIGDMLDQFGNAAPNFFSVVFNALGQSIGPSSDLTAIVRAAVKANRPLGMPFSLSGPVLVPINVAATLTLAPGASPSTVTQNALNAVSSYLNNIGMVNGIVDDPAVAASLAEYSEVIFILRGLAGVTNVTSVTLNGGTLDILGSYGQELVAGSIIFVTQ